MTRKAQEWKTEALAKMKARQGLVPKVGHKKLSPKEREEAALAFREVEGLSAAKLRDIRAASKTGARRKQIEARIAQQKRTRAGRQQQMLKPIPVVPSAELKALAG